MKPNLSKIVQGLPPSGIRAFFDLVLEMKDVISLGVGEPDFVTPWHIREKAIDVLEQGFTSYTSNKGMPELRQQVARFLKQRYRLNYDFKDQILITVGVSEGIDLCFRALLNPGDRVLIPQPAYVSYGPTVIMAGGVPVYLKTGLANGFKLTPEGIERALSSQVRVLLLNYPSNPTGASYTRRELQAIARVVKKHDLLVVTDEVYDELTYDFEHTPLASLAGMKDRVVYLNGASKAYAMTGFRLGWACGPAEIIAAMTKIHQYTMLCAPIMAQMAAREALRNGSRSVAEMKREYTRRRRFIVEELNRIGLPCHTPQGAFYVFPSISRTGQTGLEFAQDLLKQQKVALVPGSAFGADYDGHVRISYAASYEELKEAVRRIAVYLVKK